ncbi:MAG: RND transporter, partial [Actinomycetota bacterium]|nr:RND transporter [Actinomycetota bacterium]
VVYEMAGGKQVAHPVTVGQAAGGSTEITAGLTEGTQVVVNTARGAGTGSTRTGGTGRTGGVGGGAGFGGGATRTGGGGG